MPTFRNVGDEKALEVRLQRVKAPKAFTITSFIPNGGSRSIIFLPPDGDFLLSFVSGSAQGPVTAAGLRIAAGATTFQAPGTTTGYAERGLQIRVYDASSANRQLNGPSENFALSVAAQKQWMPVGDFLTPGYGFKPFFRMLPFRYLIEKGGQLNIDVQNLDTGGADQFHRLDMNFLGYMYEH